MRKIWIMAIGAAAFVAISGPPAEAAHPTNCATAHEDIAHLEHEKKSTVERLAKVVSAIMPLGLVLHAATGSEVDTVEIATGEYNKRIDMRIAEIKDTCGIK